MRNHNRVAARPRTAATSAATSRRPTEYAHALAPLLDAYGNDPRLRLVLYTLDETDVHPRAGAARRRLRGACCLGAPWWFLDTPEGLRRFREAVTETAGFYNTAGFVDDTRAFCSIPVRHDVARRVDAGFLARLVAEHRLALDEAAETIVDLAVHHPPRGLLPPGLTELAEDRGVGDLVVVGQQEGLGQTIESMASPSNGRKCTPVGLAVPAGTMHR